MFTKRLLFFALAVFAISFTSCQQEEDIATKNEVSPMTLAKIAKLGFNTQQVEQVDGGYVVEGDIFLSNADLNTSFKEMALRVGESEQYRTSNLVSAPRTISISISNQLPGSYVAALDEAINRYNAQGLELSFQRVSSKGDISLTKAPRTANYLASAGFPSGGKPYNSVKINSNYLGSNPGTNYLATIIAHEIGHCIGFRHTDYMDRSYSCGGSYYNEGASTVGAIHIPGTPTGPDANSWMLACIANGVNRPFNNNDKTALGYLY
ncbi:protease [Pontibacter sp. JH31]|uniref:Protease n=1 Tax=Pontibacter aquaedesilientis TaxID=2766980 RepID=A0ABR7XE05_9BACT|nr:M57 family metalloprotease [Pontibacter aquaedesilientis]MBD1396531.1 protease [Pontibacter aquaedesilientis]